MLQVAQRMLGDEEEAEDVVQDALLKLWQLRDEPVRNVDGLAKVMVRNMCLDRLRRRRETVSVDEYEVEDSSHENERDELIEKLLALVETLPSKQQTILKMRYLRGLKWNEIASLMGTSEEAARQTLSRVRKKVRAAIGVAASVAILLTVTTIALDRTADTSLCVMYDNGKTVTDETAVMANMESTMSDLFADYEENNVELQMMEIMK